MATPSVGQGRRHQGEMEGRHQCLPLPHRRLCQLPGTLVEIAQARRIGSPHRRGERAVVGDRVGTLEPEPTGRLQEPILAQLVGHEGERNVRRVGQRLLDVEEPVVETAEVAVGDRLAVPIVDLVPDPGVLDPIRRARRHGPGAEVEVLRPQLVEAVVEAGRRRDQLEHRSRRVLAVEGPMEVTGVEPGPPVDPFGPGPQLPIRQLEG